MGKIILTQEFDSIEEKEEYEIACNAMEYKIALDKILEMLRKYDKYGHTFNSVEEAIGRIRDEAIIIYQEEVK